MRTLLPARCFAIARLAAVFSVSASSLASLGCTADSAPPVSALYVVPASLAELHDERFFDHPWPSDLRLEGGAPRFEGYYNPRALPTIAAYITSMKGVLDGFSPAAAGFLRFAAPIDPATLPATPLASLSPDAAVQLIDVDPTSPERGKRKLFSLQYQETEGVYILANTLSFLPAIGYPLLAHTRYALVVTDALRGKEGGSVEPSADLRAVLSTDATLEARLSAARHTLAPAITEIEAAGIQRDRIVHLAVFTTADPVKELFTVRDHLRAQVPPPTALPDQWRVNGGYSTYSRYDGVYGPSPNYQDGKLPFVHNGDGGQFRFVDGRPQVVDTFNPRFALTVPKRDQCPMPAQSYPIVLYAHGTGGNFASFLQDGTAKSLAQLCIAGMGVDQIFHGTRPGAPANGSESTIELLFFNFENPIAGRTNGRQSALDEVQRARLFTESHLAIPAAYAVDGQEIRFDPSKVMFMGHSQGGLNGPLYLAADDSARGGVLSGSGALITIGLLEKTKPTPSVAALVKTVFLGLRGDEAAEANEFHPIISMAQMIIDVVDPIHYGRYLASAPRPDFAPKSVYMTEGINPDGEGDSYAPPHGIEAHAIAIGLPLELPFEHPIAELAWGGPGTVTVPADGLAGNLGGGAASGVLKQWPVPAGRDGHFVIFDVPEARAQFSRFLRNLADDAKGRVPAL